MGVGKSAVADELCQRLGAGEKIILDEGWGICRCDRRLIPEFRYGGGQERYEDIRGHGNDAIVLELGCGEPMDLAFAGATRAATEWLSVLEGDSREVLLFRLAADWDVIRSRMQTSRRFQLLMARIWYNAYATNLDIVSLPAEIQQRERVIDVSTKSEVQVADEIMAAAGIG